MLNQIFTDPISLRATQAICAALFALLVALIARSYGVNLQRETTIALLRGFIQILLVGYVLTLVLEGEQWLSILVLVGMMVIGATNAAQRAKQIPKAWQITSTAILIGSGGVMMVMLLLGILDTEPTSLIPVGSILIANAMNATSLALDRLSGEVKAHIGHTETALALGASPSVAIAPYLQAAVRASIIPSVNNLRSLGIVWIPGLMAGMILAGSDPFETAIYQFVVIALLFATASTSALLGTLLAQNHLFTSAEQLIPLTEAKKEE